MHINLFDHKLTLFNTKLKHQINYAAFQFDISEMFIQLVSQPVNKHLWSPYFMPVLFWGHRAKCYRACPQRVQSDTYA